MKPKDMIKIYKLKTLQVTTFLRPKMESFGFVCTDDENGNLICHRHPDIRDEHRPYLFAHVDTVHNVDDDFNAEKNVFYDQAQKVFWSPEGLGGDDRNGIIIILSLLETYKGNLSVIFFQDEECGGYGSLLINESEFEECSYGIAIDRRGRHDVIFDTYTDKISSDAFKFLISGICKKHLLRPADGMFTDAVNVSDRMRVSCINLSAGYYEPHTEKEYARLNDMMDIKNFILDIFKNVSARSKYEHISDRLTYWKSKTMDAKAYAPVEYTKYDGAIYQKSKNADFTICRICKSDVDLTDGYCIYCGEVPDEIAKGYYKPHYEGYSID